MSFNRQSQKENIFMQIFGSSLHLKDIEYKYGYNLGTVAPKPHKWAEKPYQNDAILTWKAMEFMIYIEPKKEFEWEIFNTDYFWWQIVYMIICHYPYYLYFAKNYEIFVPKREWIVKIGIFCESSDFDKYIKLSKKHRYISYYQGAQL